ncbi:MAG: condensation domain-containing protein, partial [Methylococcales bacterium]
MKHLLSQLINSGVRLSATAEGELKIQLGSYLLGDAEKAAIKANKTQILEYLGGGKIACQSYSQERLWFLDQLGYGAQYHVPAFGRVEGLLDVAALTRTVGFLSARHESLRSNFTMLDNTAVQKVRPVADMVIEQVDLSHLPPAQLHLEQKQRMQSFLERPFDLEHDGLFRVVLIKVSAHTHILGLCLHHIITDGWSMRVLLRDLLEAYAAFSNDRLPALKPLPLDYSAYAVWEREVLTDAKLSRELNYWKTQLSGYQNLAMPLDFVRPPRLSGQGSYRQFDLSMAQGRAIKQVSRERKTTAFTLFMSAVYTLLSKYSGQTDICMGMPVANRYQRDLEDIVGFFVNTVVMRINPPEGQVLTVNGLLTQVQQVIVNGQDNQNAPVEKILELLHPERDLSRSPIFQVLINYAPLSLGQMPFGNCTLEPLFEFEIKEAKFDLTFTYNEFDDDHASIGIEYASDLYHPDSIGRMSRHLARLMQCFVESPDLPVAQITLLDDAERAVLLEDWNWIQTDYPKDVCIHELFAQQANKTPDNLAVIFEDQRLSYRQLH